MPEALSRDCLQIAALSPTKFYHASWSLLIQYPLTTLSDAIVFPCTALCYQYPYTYLYYYAVGLYLVDIFN